MNAGGDEFQLLEFQLLEFSGEFLIRESFFCFLWFCCQRRRYFGDTLADLEVCMVIDDMMCQ